MVCFPLKKNSPIDQRWYTHCFGRIYSMPWYSRDSRSSLGSYPLHMNKLTQGPGQRARQSMFSRIDCMDNYHKRIQYLRVFTTPGENTLVKNVEGSPQFDNFKTMKGAVECAGFLQPSQYLCETCKLGQQELRRQCFDSICH